MGEPKLGMTRRLALFPRTIEVAAAAGGDCLAIAGCDLSDLAESHGTPLYVYDAATLHAAVLAYRQTLLESYPGDAGITYAGKAFLCIALAQWLHRQGLSVDCAGLGELRIAVAAGLPRERIVIHGVNKSQRYLAAGLLQAGTIVVDSLGEIAALTDLVGHGDRLLPDVWLRFRPGHAPDSHRYIQTGQADSKFGMNQEEIRQAASLCRSQQLPLRGLHFHLGSQYRDPGPVVAAIDKALDLARELTFEPGWVLCPGGGLGVAYHEDDLPEPSIEAFTRLVAESVIEGCDRKGIPLPHLQFEPGRSLIARAGVAIYSVGGTKRTEHRRWLLLDGGLADNPRPALYQARYSALPVQRPLRPPVEQFWFAGPYCESGDILVHGLPFPELRPGELVAIPVSGAYQLSMASNYNGASRPAVLWLEEGQASLVRARETTDDLFRRDRPLPGTGGLISGTPFAKYHGFGNDYIVVRARDLREPLTEFQIQRICDRHYGFGSDGILLDISRHPVTLDSAPSEHRFALRIYNPDGSEAEKSGNGLSIFSRFLWDAGWVQFEPFPIWTQGGEVVSRVHKDGSHITVVMGRLSFDSHQIPVTGPHREVVGEALMVDGEELTCCAVTLGNPHCVVLCPEVSPELARRLGPLVENHAMFPNRTNVQFMSIQDRNNIEIEIWERGAGYTLASGSSSCAAAGAALKLGLCERSVAVHTAGGRLKVSIAEDWTATLTSFVTKVWEGTISEEAFRAVAAADQTAAARSAGR